MDRDVSLPPVEWRCGLNRTCAGDEFPGVVCLNVVTSLHTGGIARSVTALLVSQSRHIPVHLAVLTDRIDDVSSLEQVGVAVSCLRHSGLRRVVRTARRLRTLLIESGASVVHSNLPLDRLVAGFVARSLGVTHVSTLHYMHSPDLSRMRRVLLRSLWAIQKLLTDHFIAISPSVEKFAIEELRISRSRLSLIPHGVSQREALSLQHRTKIRESLGIANSSSIIFAAARLDPVKRLDYAIRALASPSLANCSYLIAGQGSERAALEEVGKSLGLSNRVRMLGLREDVPDLMQCVDVYVCASEREGLGVALLEAMSAGLPIVAVSAPGVDDAVGEVGLIVSAAPEALAAGVAAVLADSDLRREMSSKGRERASSLFSAEASARSVLEVYARELAQPRWRIREIV